MDKAFNLLKEIVENVEKVIVGKRQAVENVVISLAAGGHVLIEDVPGIGKTTLVSALAKSIGVSFNRIQFTPDILPTDITGFSIYNPKTCEFEYRQGSIMSHIILADEINRTSPKTQASMLEVMEERQVTVDGKSYKVPNPFMVLATQNPVEYLGTYPLPEAQLDRFLMKITIGYPTKGEECSMLNRFKDENPIDTLEPVAVDSDILEIRSLVKKVHINSILNSYIVDITSKTRTHPDIELGCSPRASIYLYRAAQAMALYQGRDYVLPDDIKKLVVPVLGHRMILKQEVRLKRTRPESILLEIMGQIPVPVVKG